jgi:hypothetical protein
MKQLANIFGPIIVLGYSLAFAVEHQEWFQEYTKHPFTITTACFVIIGCILWFSYGVATFDE